MAAFTFFVLWQIYLFARNLVLSTHQLSAPPFPPRSFCNNIQSSVGTITAGSNGSWLTARAGRLSDTSSGFFPGRAALRLNLHAFTVLHRTASIFQVAAARLVLAVYSLPYRPLSATPPIPLPLFPLLCLPLASPFISSARGWWSISANFPKIVEGPRRHHPVSHPGVTLLKSTPAWPTGRSFRAGPGHRR